MNNPQNDKNPMDKAQNQNADKTTPGDKPASEPKTAQAETARVSGPNDKAGSGSNPNSGGASNTSSDDKKSSSPSSDSSAK